MCHLDKLIVAAGEYCGSRPCGDCAILNQDQLSQEMIAYQQAAKEIEQSGDFDTTDDFTFVVQPFFTNSTLPYFPNGTVNKNFWGQDCYHYSAYGHALLSTFFWQNMLEPVGAKTSNANLSVSALPLACPDPVCI
uniref:Uncharacterized protein n=1 Tax=Acrobeloides nanus TaxID=290746 RepID=A0A914DHX7_9BILA